MFEDVFSFIDRHRSFVLTTHDSPDADGFGAQMVMFSILKKSGKEIKIINADPFPKHLDFLDGAPVEIWDEAKHSSDLQNSALMILDTCEEYHIGSIRKVLKNVKEAFVFDHHEPGPHSKLSGLIDHSAASTSEMAIELALCMDVALDQKTAAAAYAGIVFDSGFFAYPKTSIRTFKAAMKALEWGADPNYIYRQLMENSSYSSVLLQKQALSHLQFHHGRRLAVMTLSMEDLRITGAEFEEAENIVNIPLKAKEVEISILLKEKTAEEIRCSLRSKGTINVSKIAQGFGGGGHVTAAGFRSSLSMEKILNKLISDMEARLNDDYS
jgi:phosphoesterase RecJ-like protein